MNQTYNSKLENLANDNFLRAIFKQKTDHTPIWIMRQAGRYLPEYRQVREKAGDFLSLCKNPELAAEVTIQPITRFGLDAAIIFSDILTIADALNLGLSFNQGEGPKLARPIATQKDVDNLPQLYVASDLNYVFEAIKVTKSRLQNKVPLIGFSASPWTLATYLIEGGSSKNFHKIKTLMYQNPEVLHSLLAKITQITIEYLNLQIAAGVNAIQIFDSWGGILANDAYAEFSLNYVKPILASLNATNSGNPVAKILFTKGGGLWLEDMSQVGANVLGLDWTISLDSAIARLGDNVALQGNLDPSVLFANPKVIKTQAEKILQAARKTKGFVFNLGHGIDKSTKIENVQALVETVQNWKI